jgi:Acetoacetate decarboxylase (ADC)
MTFPSPPWRMQGQLWLSLLRTSVAGPGERPAGTYGVALVDYQPGSPLTYGELLVARPVSFPSGPPAGRHVTVTDIWVDSEPSREGGRSLWAVPKELAAFTWSTEQRDGRRPVSAAVPGIATAEFGAPPVVLPRTPFSGTTWQPREDGSSVVAPLTGSSRAFVVRGSWTFDPDGPLGWLTGARTLASFVMRDFRMTFG